MDLISAADIRYCTDDAWFQIKEIELGMAADVGTLQRVPKVIGNQSLVREWCFTGRKISSSEALNSGLVSRTFKNQDELVAECIKLATTIANKSPVAMQATKKNLVYSIDHTTQEGLDQIVSLRSSPFTLRPTHMHGSHIVMNSLVAERDKQTESAVRRLHDWMHGSSGQGRDARVCEIVIEMGDLFSFFSRINASFVFANVPFFHLNALDISPHSNA